MTIGSIGGIQDPKFIEAINRPQVYNVTGYQPQMSGQPSQDMYVSRQPQQEEKGGFGKFLVKLGLAAALVLGGNRLAHSQGWMKAAKAGSDDVIDKFVRKPSKELDDWVQKQVKHVEGWFKSGKTDAPEGKQSEAATE